MKAGKDTSWQNRQSQSNGRRIWAGLERKEDLDDYIKTKSRARTALSQHT